MKKLFTSSLLLAAVGLSLGLVGCDNSNSGNNEVRQYVVRADTCTVQQFMDEGAWIYIMPSNTYVASVTIKSTGNGYGTVNFSTLEGTFIYDVELAATGDSSTGELTQVTIDFVGLQPVGDNGWISRKNLGIGRAMELVDAGARVVLDIADAIAVPNGNCGVVDSTLIRFYGPWTDGEYPLLESNMYEWAMERMAGSVEFWIQNPSGEPSASEYGVQSTSSSE